MAHHCLSLTLELSFVHVVARVLWLGPMDGLRPSHFIRRAVPPVPSEPPRPVSLPGGGNGPCRGGTALLVLTIFFIGVVVTISAGAYAPTWRQRGAAASLGGRLHAAASYGQLAASGSDDIAADVA